ncbi:hypothetical protein [Halosimplex sp. J119]
MKRQLLNAFLVLTLITSSLGGTVGPEMMTTATADSRECTNTELFAIGFTLGFAGFGTDCEIPWNAGAVNTTQEDAQQLKLDLYQSAQNSKANADLYQTTVENSLQDTENIALMIAKNQYVRELNNGSSKAAAKTAAKQKALDYYAGKQKNLAEQWRLQLQHGEYMKGVAQNESGIGDNFASFVEVTSTGPYKYDDQGTNRYIDGYENFTLVNSTTVNIPYMYTQYYTRSDTTSGTTADHKLHFGEYINESDEIHGFAVKAPDSNYDRLLFVDLKRYKKANDEIVSQSQSVQSEIDSFVETTYDQYQTGEINNSDLIDPYMMNRQYSPNGSFQAWATTSLTLMGANTPENVQNVGSFEVEAGSQKHEGMLLSDETPASGMFEAGNTYDPEAIGGQQYVVTDDRIVELQRNFTIRNITNSDGENVQNVTVRKVNYNTANMTELRELNEELASLRAEVEAREQKKRNSGGAGFLPNGFGGFGGGLVSGGLVGVVAAIIGIIALVMLLWPVIGPAIIS